MLTHRRAIRERKRRYKGLERKERTNEKKETGESGMEEGQPGKKKKTRGSEMEEGQPGKKKTKRKRSKNRKRKWRMKEPISNISAHKTNIIEDKEDDEEEVSYQKNMY